MLESIFVILLMVGGMLTMFYLNAKADRAFEEYENSKKD